MESFEISQVPDRFERDHFGGDFDIESEPLLADEPRSSKQGQGGQGLTHNLGDEENPSANVKDKDTSLETEQIDDLDLMRMAGSSTMCMCLARADALDRRLSERVASINSLPVELIMMPFGHFFNRFYNILGFILTAYVGSLRYNHMLEATGYQPLRPDITAMTKFRLGLSFLAFYSLVSAVMIGIVWVMKLVVKR